METESKSRIIELKAQGLYFFVPLSNHCEVVWYFLNFGYLEISITGNIESQNYLVLNINKIEKMTKTLSEHYAKKRNVLN